MEASTFQHPANEIADQYVAVFPHVVPDYDQKPNSGSKKINFTAKISEVHKVILVTSEPLIP
jgi:hypothetical protein